MTSEHVLEIARLNRLYAALSQINQAIVRVRSREELLTRVCQILVAPGGFQTAWIGWYDPETHRLLPIAQAGDEDDYLASIEIYGDDRPGGRGPTGTAFRHDRPYVCNDLLEDPSTLPWREQYARRGFRASAAFPIHVDGAARGALSVYADTAGFFLDEEIALLTEAAADLSYALDNLTHEAARLRAESIARRAGALATRERAFAIDLIESMPGVFYSYDEHGRFLRWNRNFEKVTGYGAAEIAWMHPTDFFASADKELLVRKVAEVFEQGEASVEASLVAKDGTATPYFFTGRRILFEDAPHLVGVGIDIAERRRAEAALKKSEERYRTTLETSFQGFQLLDFDWRYLYLNPASALQNRRPNDELLGRTMMEAWPGIEGSHVFAHLRTCMEQRTAVHTETQFGFPDGTSGWFEVRAQPVPEGIFVISVDISQRKLAENTLRELNENLERKVATRTADLEIAKHRAEAADRIKSAFLATMSHELRTPLNSILGFTGIVLKGMAGPLNAEQSKQLGMVQGSARHLLDLINDVLDISKIEAGQLEVHRAPFDLRASVERVALSLMPLAERKGIRLSVVLPDADEPMVSDKRRVEQILLNLLNNAIKFTDRGQVTLSVQVATEGPPDAPGPPRTLRIRVADSGIGIEPENLAKLFQPFVQLDSGLQRQHEGTGLGLAICRRLTELLGGTIQAESVRGEGSVFTVVLPMTRNPTP